MLGSAQLETALPYFELAQCRPRGLGGSTGLWGGWCEQLDGFDFEERPELVSDGTSTAWPFPIDDLAPYYRSARAFCGIPEVTTSRAWHLAHEPGTRDSPLAPRSFPVLGPRQLGRRHVELFAGDRVDLLLGATATRLVTSGAEGTVDRVATRAATGELTISAPRFVLAVGGIETARILLSSTSAAWPHGLGNNDDLVGRCFMEHPHVDALRATGDPMSLDVEFFLERPAGVTLDREPMAAAGALVLSDEACRAARVGRVQLFIEPAGAHAVHPLPRVRDGRPLRLRPRPPRSDELAVIVATEQVPTRDSRITLSTELDHYGVPLPALQWRLAEVDHRTARVGAEAARELLIGLGAKNVRRRLRRAGWPIDTLGGPHHLGTARMGKSPSDGVVDGNCRVHDVSDLFVAGGATFPRSGYAPPTLTMLALAFRLSDHLRSA